MMSLGIGGVLVMRMAFVGVCDRLVAVRITAEQRFQVAGRNARQPKHHTSRRNDAETERKLWLAVRHTVSSLLGWS